MIGSILRQVTRMNPVTLRRGYTITTGNGAIEQMPKGINMLAPISVPIVVSVGIYCGAKASEYGAWLLKEFSLFEYEDDDDDDD